MRRKQYTAQEMRNMADCINNIKQSEMPSWKEGEIITGGDLCRSAEMLRQAADVRERIGELLITYHSCPDQRDLLNFILTGHEEENKLTDFCAEAIGDIKAKLQGDAGKEIK